MTPFALQGGAEWNDPDSYQSLALARVEEQENIDSQTDAKLVQYYSLYSIFAATNGVRNEFIDANPVFDDLEPEDFQWVFRTNWQATNVDPCDNWYGVVCNAEDRVTDLELDSNGLTGNFPPEVTLLASDGARSSGAGELEKLELFRNEFNGNFGDTSWWSDLGSNFSKHSSHTILCNHSVCEFALTPKLLCSLQNFSSSARRRGVGPLHLYQLE